MNIFRLSSPLAIFAGWFVLIFGAAVAIAWPIWLGIEQLVAIGVVEESVRFYKVASRLFLLVAAVSMWPLVRLLGVNAREFLGWNLSRSQFLRDLGVGLVIGIAMLGTLVALLLLFGVRVPAAVTPGASELIGYFLKAMVAGLLIGLMEETFFRGALYGVFRRHWPVATAVIASSLVYAAMHFLRPSTGIGPDASGWSSGFILLSQLFTGLGDPAIFDSLLALFVAGVLLAVIRSYVGSIALCAGMHAGWVTVIKVSKKLTSTDPQAEWAWLAGSYDGIIGYLGAVWLLAFGLVGWWLCQSGRLDGTIAGVKAAVIRVTLTVLGWLPLPLLHAMGWMTGWLLASFPNKLRTIVLTNIALCFPAYGHLQRMALVRQSLCELGKTVFETGLLWSGGRRRALHLVREVEGQEHIDAAIQAGNGIIIAAPHQGSWEAVGIYLGERYGITSLYRPPRLAALDGYIRNVRQRSGAHLVATGAGGVKALYAALDRGAMIGILPDQQPRQGTGVFAPFFGVAAWTMALLPRLALKTGAPVVIVWAERLPRGEGFRIHCRPVVDKLSARSSVQEVAAAVNLGIQQIVEQFPAQYQWSYRRFSRRPDGEPSLYDAVSLAPVGDA